MNEYSGLIEKISQEYDIERAEKESEPEWKARVIYSVIGESALASLWDKNEDEIPISVEYFKSIMIRTFKAYGDLYHSAKELFDVDIKELADEMYTDYESMGYLYHMPKRVMPSVEAYGEFNRIRYARGLSLDQKHKVSGIGEYFIGDSSGNEEEILRLFHIDGEPLVDFWERVSKQKEWSIINMSGKVEYLRTDKYFTRGYWVDKPDRGSGVSLLRMGEPGGRIYFLYKNYDEKIVCNQLPSWMTEDGNYRKIANAVLASRNALPKIEVIEWGSVVKIRFNYLPAKDIHQLIKLYSWPGNYRNSQCDFDRIMSLKVWKSLKELVKYLGYSLEG